MKINGLLICLIAVWVGCGHGETFNPSTMDYGPTICEDGQRCTLAKRGFVRYGVAGKYVYSERILEAGESFLCADEGFGGQDPYQYRAKSCSLSEPLSLPTAAPTLSPTVSPVDTPQDSELVQLNLRCRLEPRLGLRAVENLDACFEMCASSYNGRNGCQYYSWNYEAFECTTYDSSCGNPSNQIYAFTQNLYRYNGPVPTKNPTTPQPSRFPSASPTTSSPTPFPTTRAPTPFPTTSPPTTRQPTASNPTTSVPSRTPTSSRPSASPTRLPTGSPTRKPSFAPTVNTLLVCLGSRTEPSCLAHDFCTWTEETGCVLRNPKTGDGDDDKLGGNASGDSGEVSWVSIVATNIAIIGVVLALSALIFIQIHRHKPVIQLSQALFLKLLCIGALLVNTSIFPNAFEAQSKGLCVARKWWFDVTFTFTLAIMLVKTWRVWRVFHGPSSNCSHITNVYLLKRVVAIVLVDIIILCCWTFVGGGPEPVFNQEVESYRCESSDGAGQAFLVISYIFLCVMVLATTFLAYRVKDLGSVLGESKQIFLIMNNILVFGIFNLVLSIFDSTSEIARVLVFAVSVFWCTTLGLVVLLQSKYEKFDLTREQILLQATEKKSSTGYGGGGSSSRNSNPVIMSDHVRTDTGRFNNSSTNGGFVDKAELDQLASNNSEKVPQRGSTYFDTPGLASSFMSMRGGAQTMQEPYAPYSAVEEGHGSVTWNEQQSDRIRRATSGGLIRPPSPGIYEKPVSEATNHRPISFKKRSFSSGLDITKLEEDPKVSEVRTKPSGPSNAEAIIANGFKIGERGDWEEYVHRTSGESYWLHKETGEVSHSYPEEEKKLQPT